MTGVVQEYRDENGRVIAFAHEVFKGDTARGQWYYADEEAARRYVWFHSVRSLVQRAVAAEGVYMVDLGPSGSDAFSELKVGKEKNRKTKSESKNKKDSLID